MCPPPRTALRTLYSARASACSSRGPAALSWRSRCCQSFPARKSARSRERWCPAPSQDAATCCRWPPWPSAQTGPPLVGGQCPSLPRGFLPGRGQAQKRSARLPKQPARQERGRWWCGGGGNLGKMISVGHRVGLGLVTVTSSPRETELALLQAAHPLPHHQSSRAVQPREGSI